MGGGDLNMKKSWHPLTMQNLERVWKAEQRHEAEQKRIAELQQEIKEERAREEMKQFAVDTGISKSTEDRVDWLYRGPMTSDKEEYLLGKKIDKSIDPTLIEEEREKQALASGPGSLFSSAETANSATDFEMKIREDPLFLMKKREEEAKKRILNNPVKMKQLQEMLSKDKKKKHKSLSKKHKSRYHSDSESDNEDEDSRYLSKDSKHYKSKDDRYTRDRSPRHRGAKETLATRGPDTTGTTSSRGAKETLTTRGPDTTGTTSSSTHYKSRSVHRERRYGPTAVSRKMDPKELEKRRKAMMSTAKRHDKERKLKFHEHQEELKKEESMLGKEEQFLKKLRVQSITSSQTIEDRIHRHINSVQRTKASLDDFINK